MSDLKKYRVIDNSSTRGCGVLIGDICYLSDHEPFGIGDGLAWFYNENWYDDGVWLLKWSDVEEINEVDSNE